MYEAIINNYVMNITRLLLSVEHAVGDIRRHGDHNRLLIHQYLAHYTRISIEQSGGQASSNAPCTPI